MVTGPQACQCGAAARFTVREDFALSEGGEPMCVECLNSLADGFWALEIPVPKMVPKKL